MDQGIAALIAGAAGMVGALGGAVTGGIAAVRGARIGAEQTAHATRQQVKDQAAAEHAHWLREQRQGVYSAFMLTAQSFEQAAEKLLRDMHFQDSNNTHQENFDEALRQLVVAVNSVALLGPGAMIEASASTTQCALNFQHRMLIGFPNSRERHDTLTDIRNEFIEHHQEFVMSARNVLGNFNQ